MGAPAQVLDWLLDWLLDSDPALRWQVERDLAEAPPAVWEATRARVPHEGFGARLLALQDPDGRWAGGAFFPADADPSGPQPFTATTWVLNSLREWGVDPGALGDTADRLAHARWEYDDLPYWGGEVDCCINAWTLLNGGWLGVDVNGLVRWFEEHRMADGGWNCAWVEGSTRSSFHSTLAAVRALRDAQRRTGATPSAAAGEEYLLERRLLRRASTGELLAPWVTDHTYPFRWGYSALNALDHFRDVGVRDDRMAEAVEVVRSQRRTDGRWTRSGRFPGAVPFEVDAPAGEPSRWVTFLALRVLRWWDA
ncbi:squalene cyclase [Kineococcus sp. DHX-1]|uniref:squalene cyclase n=1 Tax=Kineococcus sp. DHX-1 TaxID=3349638 RepID=UPI0036D3F8A7